MSTVHHAFRAAALSKDGEQMRACLAEDVTFSSPAVHRPIEGIDAVSWYLAGAAMTFEDFAYVGELADDHHAMLRFTARVGDRDVEGVDLLDFDDDGKVVRLTVMVRPLRGLEAVVARMQDALEAARGPSRAM